MAVLDPLSGQIEQQRNAMVEGRGIRDTRVLAAMRRVPRLEFVPKRLREFGCEDTPLPIGQDQNISRP